VPEPAAFAIATVPTVVLLVRRRRRLNR